MRAPHTAVALVSHRSHLADLSRALHSITSQQLPDGWTQQILLALTGITPDTPLPVDLPATVHLLTTPVNTHAAGLNLAYRHADADYFFDLDPTVWLTPTSLTDRIRHLAASDHAWSVGQRLALTTDGGPGHSHPHPGFPEFIKPMMRALLEGHFLPEPGTRTYRMQDLALIGPWEESTLGGATLDHALRATAIVGPPAHCPAWLAAGFDDPNITQQVLDYLGTEPITRRWSTWQPPQALPDRLPTW